MCPLCFFDLEKMEPRGNSVQLAIYSLYCEKKSIQTRDVVNYLKRQAEADGKAILDEGSFPYMVGRKLYELAAIPSSGIVRLKERRGQQEYILALT
jgi:hypothetical protein